MFLGAKFDFNLLQLNKFISFSFKIMFVIFKSGFGEDKLSLQACYQMAKPRIELYVNDKEMEVILYM